MYKIKHISGKFLKKGFIGNLLCDAYGWKYRQKMHAQKRGLVDGRYEDATKGLVCSCVLTVLEKSRSYQLKSAAQEVVNDLNNMAPGEWELVIYTLVEKL
jgi:hypothetical protein